MRNRYNNSNFVSVTLDLPLEVAEFLRDNSDEIFGALKLAVADFHRNPTETVAEQRTRDFEAARKSAALKQIEDGRFYARLIRRRSQLDKYRSPEGEQRVRKIHSTQKWEHLVSHDLASEQLVELDYFKFIALHHRQKFNFKLRDRRVREAVRYAKQGLSNSQIAAKLKVSPRTVGKYFAEALGESPKGDRKWF